MLACEYGELNIVRELLEAHVDPNAVDMVWILIVWEREREMYVYYECGDM